MKGTLRNTLVVIGIAALSAGALAQGSEIPREINYQGLLTDQDTGSPLAGPVDLTFMIFRLDDCGSGTAPDALWSETHTGVELSDGIFNVRLGSLTVFPDTMTFKEPYCLSIQVGEEELLPRQEILAVAHALGAHDAVWADSARTVLELPAHVHDGRYYTESELDGPGTINDPSNPVDWSRLKNVPAGFADGTDNTGAGGGLEVLAGPGLREEVIGDVKILSVDAGGIQETMLADSAVTGDKIRSNSITSAQIAPGAVTAGEIAAGTITSAQISSNTITAAQIAPTTITAAQLAPSTITSAQISPATITAGEVSLNTLTADQLAASSVKSDELADSAVTAAKIMPGAVGSAAIADSSILFIDINRNGAADGQVMKWNGGSGAWKPGEDLGGGIGDITSVGAGAGLTGGGDTLDVLLGVLFAGTGSADSVARSDHDHDGDYVNEGQPGSVSGPMIGNGAVTTLGIADGTILFADIDQNGAAAGQVMKWNGSAWVAADDSAGTGSGGGGGWVDDGGSVRLENPLDMVGIGTASPAAKLDVDGDLRASGTAIVGSGHAVLSGTGVNLTGEGHQAGGDHVAISGGSQNQANGDYATIGGGRENYAGDEHATVGGGGLNQAAGRYSVVAGGGGETGGDENRAEGDWCAVAGGSRNTAGGAGTPWEEYAFATVGGGRDNEARRRYCTVGGGRENRAEQEYATVGGGWQNLAEARSTVAGGENNSAFDGGSAVGGGMNNTASRGGTVGGGMQNRATGDHAAVPGGRENEATGNGSFAAGTQARARHEGSFVLAANYAMTGDDTISTGGGEQLVIRADGGIYITGASEQAPYDPSRLINTSTGAYLSSAGQWHDSSDRALKENFEPVDGEDLLERIAALPVTRWNYRSEGARVKHIGPVAQDFRAVLGIGGDERTIAALDGAGVSLAAIQELYRKAVDQESEIEELRTEIEELRALVRALLEEQ